jgi:hypothetical protein
MRCHLPLSRREEKARSPRPISPLESCSRCLGGRCFGRWRTGPHLDRVKNSSDLIFWHPRVSNEAPYVGTPGAAGVSNLTSHSYCLDTFVLVVAATEMIESAALLKSLGIEKITPASGTDEVLRGPLE